MLITRGVLLKKIRSAVFKNTRRCFSESNKKWSIVFFGTDHFALQSLQKLHHAMLNGEIVKKLSVVVPAPKPNPCVVAKYAKQHSIPFDEWPLPKESPLKGDWELGVVASFGHLIPKRIINAFPKGMLNIHASLLPRWRGAAPIIHALMNGDKETGITIMQIKPFHFDVGDIILQERIPIDQCVMAPALTHKLAETGSDLIVRCLSDLENHLARGVPQPSHDVTLAPKVGAHLSHIDWSQLTAEQVYNRWRGTQHLFKLQTSFHGDNVKLDGMALPTEPPATVPLKSTTSQTGCVVVDRQRNLLLVRCKEGWAAFRHVTLPRRPVMSAVDFANGYLKKRPEASHFFTASNPAEADACAARMQKTQ